MENKADKESGNVREDSLTCFLQQTYGGRIVVVNIPKPDLSYEDAEIEFEKKPKIAGLKDKIDEYFNRRGYSNMAPNRQVYEDMFSGGMKIVVMTMMLAR